MHMPTRVKICGITRIEDALAAAEAGADAIGLMFVATSPRHVDLAQAVKIRRALPPFVAAVAVFLDASRERVREVVQALRPDLLQFHGNESEDYCTASGLPFIKTVPMLGDAAARMLDAYPRASALLLDSHARGESGGTGRTFDWGRLPAALRQPMILAGGLKPANVAEAVRVARPYAVDVSSGVESAPGIKDSKLIRDFMHEVRSVH